MMMMNLMTMFIHYDFGQYQPIHVL